MAARRKDAGDQFGLTPQEEVLAAVALTQLLSTPRGRRIALVLLLCAILFAAGWWLARGHQSRVHLATGPTVRIATWNMHVFAPRPAIRLDIIAGIIRSSNFDIVALQEIRENGEEVESLLDTLGSPWKRTTFSPMTGNHERFVFIYNSEHVAELGPPHSINSADAPSFNRTPYEDTFEAGRFDFTLITCHLFYGDNPAGHARRKHEAQMLADYAKQEVANGQDKDVIVLGDFNETVGLGNLHFFTDAGWEELNRDPTNLESTQVYDNLLIDPHQVNEWTGTAGSIHYDEKMFPHNERIAVEEVSDHRPAYADFVTTLRNN
jgi:exonuclease III